MDNETIYERITIEQQIIREGFTEILEIVLIDTENRREIDLNDLNINNQTNNTSNQTNNTSNQTNNTSNQTNNTSNQTNNTSNQTNNTSNNQTSENSTEYIEQLLFEEAEVRAKISISYRKVSGFKQDGNTISFFFYGLTTKSLEAKTEITMFVNLIDINGRREENETKTFCTLIKDVSLSERDLLAQAVFECSVSNLTEEYYSFRYNYSDYISGVPTDEALLDPKFSAETILRNEVSNYSANDIDEVSLPPIFTAKDIINVGKGQLIITGTLSQYLEINYRFIIELNYPTSTELTCYFLTYEKGPCNISCKVDRDFLEERVAFEQKIIKQGNKEILIIESFVSSSNITCINSLLLDSLEKINIPISFRQVSHLVLDGIDGFSFYLASIVSQSINAGYNFSLITMVSVGEEKKEISCICELQSNIIVNDGSLIQGDFICNGYIGSEDEYQAVDFNNSESLIISTDNPEITGISDLSYGQNSPIATDKEINQTILLKSENNGTISELLEVIDFYEEINKNKFPPILEIISLQGIEECSGNGKFIMIGIFSEDITEEIIFTFSLSFPKVKVKCTIDEAQKNVEVLINCKVQKKFTKVKSLVINQRMIRKRNKELFFLKSKTFDFQTSITCENYNDLKYLKSKGKLNSNFTFIQVSDFNSTTLDNQVSFFVAVAVNKQITFSTISVTVALSISEVSENSLRALEEPVEEEISLPITCNVSDSTDSAVGLRCKSSNIINSIFSNKIRDNPKHFIMERMRIDDEENAEISGIPQNADPSKIKIAVDFSKLENLKLINELPLVQVKSINGSNCSLSGSYIIDATYNKGEIKDTSDFEIPFGTVDSVGLCRLNVGNNHTIKIYCENKEEFSNYPIAFETTIIKDNDGKLLFKLENYTNQQQFSCSISYNSIIFAKVKSEPSNENEQNGENNGNYENNENNDNVGNNDTNLRPNIILGNVKKESSSGLSTARIVIIVVWVVIFLAIIGILVDYSNNGKIFSCLSSSKKQTTSENSTINNFSINTSQK